MKLALVLLLVLPLVMSVPKTEHRRFLEKNCNELPLLDFIAIKSHATTTKYVFDLDQLRQIVSSIAHQIAGDETEAACEAACHSILLRDDQILHTGCDFICQSFQDLMVLLDIEDVTTATP